MQQLGIFSPARERWIWHDSTAGYGGHIGLLSEVPTPISSGIPGNTQGAEAPPGRARLEALLIQVCRQKPRGLYPISLRPLVLHLQQKKKKKTYPVSTSSPHGWEWQFWMQSPGWRVSPHLGTWHREAGGCPWCSRHAFNSLTRERVWEKEQLLI